VAGSVPHLALTAPGQSGRIQPCLQIEPAVSEKGCCGQGTPRDDPSVEAALVTGRLVLRRFTAADADGLVALDGDPQVMRFLGPIRSRVQIQADVLPRFLAYQSRYPDFGYWAAETCTDAGLIGWFGLRPVTPGTAAIVCWPDAPPGDVSVAELGYRLRRSAWGRGYATEGARALVRRAFTELGVSRIVATTMTVNTRSRRVLEKAGLSYTRTVHLDWPDPLPGNEDGDVEYQLCRDDWLPRCRTSVRPRLPCQHARHGQLGCYRFMLDHQAGPGRLRAPISGR
jgi:RimJ/RimL family protein N-acetyltransferase